MSSAPGLDEGLLIPIQFSLEEARQALAQLEAQAKAAGVKIGSGVAGGTKGFADLKQEMGRGRETAMFFTQALGEFGPQGRTAQIAISGVAGAFLGGGGLLAVLGLAQAAVRMVVEAWNEEEEAAKKAAEAARQAAAEQAKRNRDALAFGDDHVANLQAMVASYKPLTMAEKAHLEVMAISAQIQVTAEGPFRRTLELRLKTALALEAQVKKLQAAKDAEEEEAYFFKGWVEVRQGGLVTLTAAEKLLADEATRHLREKTEQYRIANAEMAALVARSEELFNRVPGPNIQAPSTAEAAAARDGLEADRIRQESARETAAVVAGAYRSMTQSAAAAFGPMLTHSRAYSRAMHEAGGSAGVMADLSGAAFAKMLQDALAAKSQEALVESLWYAAKAVGYLADGRLDAAGEAAIAAGKFAAVAGIAGAGAMAIGNTRGMTRSERADVASAQAAQAGAVAGGAREVGAGFTGGGSVAERHTREVIVVTGSPFESPQETARRAARTLALMSDLNMLPRS